MILRVINWLVSITTWMIKWLAIGFFTSAIIGAIAVGGLTIYDDAEFGTPSGSGDETTPSPATQVPGADERTQESVIPTRSDAVSNPSADDDVFVVGIEQDTSGEDIVPVVRETASFWNSNAGRYEAAYQKRLVVKPGADNPDILVRYASSVACDSDASGCAPRPRSELGAEALDKPLVVKVSASQSENRLMAKRTMIHEFGHVLGIEHCERPQYRMGCPNSNIVQTEWSERKYPFNTRQLNVYIDSTGQSQTRQQVQQIVSEVNRGSLDGVPDDVQLRQVTDPWRAHITIQVDQCTGCTGGAWDSTHFAGPPYQRDEFAYLNYVSITVSASNPDSAGRGVRDALQDYLGEERGVRHPVPYPPDSGGVRGPQR